LPAPSGAPRPPPAGPRPGGGAVRRARALVAGLAMLAACAEPDPLAPRPGAHVVLVSIDTLRADHLGCYGYERPTSPHLDALAAESVLFERVLAPAPSTAPSHMTMMTGWLPAVHDVWHRALAPPAEGVVTLAQRLGAAGYATRAHADGGFVTREYGFDRGFDLFVSRMSSLEDKRRSLDAWVRPAPARSQFLFVHTYHVHAPYVPSEASDVFGDPAYAGLLVEPVERLRTRFAEHGPDHRFGADLDVFFARRQEFDAADRRRLVDLYDAEIREVDAFVGWLVDRLERDGWLEDGWLIVTSDHGEAFGEHGTYNHRQLYDEELRVPLLVRPPGGLARGLRVPESIGLVDLYPTILDLVGLDPGVTQGRSARALGTLAPRARLAVAGREMNVAAVQEGTRKVLVRDGEPFEAYELGTDPDERRDLLRNGAIPAWVEALQAVAGRRFERSGAWRGRLGEREAPSPLDPATEQSLRNLGYLR